MLILNSLFTVQMLTNLVPSKFTVQINPSTLLNCAGTCAKLESACIAFQYTPLSSQCQIIHKVTTGSSPSTKYYVKTNDCPVIQGYKFIERSGSKLCLKFHQQGKTWDAAKTLCEGSGDQLLQMPIQNKINLVKDFLNNNLGYKNKWWIGLEDVNSNNVYKWFDRSIVQHGSSNWAPGEPAFTYAGSPDDCVILNHEQSFKFDDHSCVSNNLPFICEKVI